MTASADPPGPALDSLLDRAAEKRRERLNKRLRAAFIEGAEEDSRRRLGPTRRRGDEMTDEEDFQPLPSAMGLEAEGDTRPGIKLAARREREELRRTAFDDQILAALVSRYGDTRRQRHGTGVSRAPC